MGNFKKILLASALAALMPAAVVSASEIRVGFTAEPLTLDPGNHRNRDTETVIRNLSDGLLTRDAEMKVVPEIAESFTQTSPVTFEFKIRKGVKFHDGTELTPEDVKFTLDRLTVEGGMGEGQTSPRQSLLGPVKDVEIVGGDTIRINLSEPWPLLPAMLPFQELVSKAFTEKTGTAGMATAINGTGPFKLVEWRKGDSIIMARFDDYYGGSPDIPPVGKACADRAIFKFIPEAASRVAALLAGDVDIINDLPPFSVKQVEANPNTAVMTVNGTRSVFLALNLRGDKFDDIKVRQAFAHALDKNLLIDRILGGNAVSIEGILSPAAFGASPDLPKYTHDPEKAKALLAEAGYANGIDVTIDATGADKDMAEAISAVLGKAGIRAKVAIGENAQVMAKWDPKNDKNDGDVFFTSWGNGSLDPFDIFVPTHYTLARGNRSGYSNTEVDSLLDQGSVELDPAKRAALYQKAEAIVNAELPYLYLWVPKDIYGVSKRVSGWQPSADARINLHDACVK